MRRVLWSDGSLDHSGWLRGGECLEGIRGTSLEAVAVIQVRKEDGPTCCDSRDDREKRMYPGEAGGATSVLHVQLMRKRGRS